MVAIEIVVVLLAAFLGLVGWILRKLWLKYRSLTDRLDTVEEETETLMTVLFGREIDENDEGFADEIEQGMEQLNTKIEANDDDLDDVEDVVGVIVIRLDKADAIDFDKDEVDSIAELQEYESE